MQGVFAAHGGRFKSKREMAEAIKVDPSKVVLERTAILGDEYGGPVSEMPVGRPQYVVGPDPYTNRKWYAQVTRQGSRIKVS